MPEFNVMCSETVYFTVAVTAPDAEEARNLVHKNVNGYEVISEAVSEWEIEEVLLAWQILTF